MLPLPIISNTSIYTPPIDEYNRFVQEMASSDRTFIPFTSAGVTVENQGARLCVAQFNNTVVPTNLGIFGSGWGWQIAYSLANAANTMSAGQIVGAFKQIFPSEDIFNEHILNNRLFGWTRMYGPAHGYTTGAVNRNSITTTQTVYGAASPRHGLGITDLIYYDYVTEKMMMYKPEVATRGPNIPVPYYTDSNSVPSSYVPTEYDIFFKGYCPHNNYNGTKTTTFASMTVLSSALSSGAGTYYIPTLQSIQTRATTGALLSGTSWGSYIWPSNARHILRAVQHAFPNVDAYNSYLANGYGCVIEIEVAPVTDLVVSSVARNGYTSTSGVNYTGDAIAITKLIYYDASTQKMMQCNPFEMSTPTALY